MVKVTKESVTSTEVTLNVELDSEDEDPFLDRSYRRTVNQIKIPGFRPGKAPRSIVESYVGRTALVHEALDFMIPETLNQIMQDEELKAFVEPDVEVLEVEPVSFKAVIALEPVVDLGDFHNISLELEDVDITEEQVEEVVERLRQESAPWEPAERPIQYGDMLNLNVKGSIDDNEVVNDEGVDYIPQEENVLPFPGFAPFLEGMAEDEEKNFVLTIPEDYARGEYAGKECSFEVKVLSVKEKRPPELDDEFAKGIGDGFDDLTALRTHVRGRLSEEEEARVAQQLQEKSLEELIKVATIQASDRLYQRELDAVIQERERALRNQRLDMDTYLTYVGQTEDEFREQLRPGAEERLTRYLVIRQLAQQEDIEVTPEETTAEIESMITSSGESADAMRRAFSSEGAQDSIRSSLLNRRVLEHLAAIVQGNSAEGDATPSASSQETEAEAPDESAAQIDTPSSDTSEVSAEDAPEEGA